VENARRPAAQKGGRPAPADDQRHKRHGRLVAAVTVSTPDSKPRCRLAHLLEGSPRDHWLSDGSFSIAYDTGHAVPHVRIDLNAQPVKTRT
jgi:hypothetical protein